MKNNHLLCALFNKRFSLLWIAEVFSQVGFNMMNFILIIVAFKISNSNTAVSGIVLSFTLPAVIFGILAGVYVDRWNKRNVLFITNIVRAMLLIILAFLHSNLFFIYLLSFAMSIVTQFFIPAETPMIPLVVKKKLLLSANALFGMGIYGSILVAYALSGPFLIFFGSRNVFIVLAVLFFIAAFAISFLKAPKIKKVKEEAMSLKLDFGRELRSSFSLIAKTKEIYHSLFLLTLSQVLILLFAVVGPGFAHQVLGINVEEFPLVLVTPAALGMVVGAIIIANFFHDFSREKMANIGVMLGGLSILFLPYGSKVTSREIVQTINDYLPHIFTINILHIMVFLAFVLGFANALIFVPSNTLLQEKTSDEIRGKIYGVLNSLVGISSFLPVIIVGELSDIFGVGRVLTGIGISLIAFSGLRVLMARR
ncbi:MAG: MFS transporter [Candidatus Levyibacteriota bacterium]